MPFGTANLSLLLLFWPSHTIPTAFFVSMGLLGMVFLIFWLDQRAKYRNQDPYEGDP